MKLTLSFIFLFASGSLLAQQKDSTQFNKEQKLKEVVVKTKKPFVEIQADKTVLNVQNDIVATGGNLFDILQRAPGVSVTNDESINLSGKSGVNILIDGKATQLSGKDLAAFLKATPGSVVDKVEIITNPSAKYDAQGNAGIINIRMKKNIADGTNGTISTAYTQSNHGNINFSSTLNHRKEKLNLFLNTNARKWRQNTDGAINHFIITNGISKTFENRTVDRDASTNIGFQAGADYYMNKKSTFGLLIKGNEYRSSLYTPGITKIKTNGATDSSLSTINEHPERNSRYNFNLNYKYEDTLGTELNIDLDHTYYRNKTTGLVSTRLLDKQNTQYGYTANDQDVLTTIRIYSARADYSHAFKKSNAKIEAGSKWNRIQTLNDLQAMFWKNNSFVPDTGRTNQFDYTETNYAVYASFSQKIKKWEYQVGLRGEQSVIKGKSTDLKNNLVNYPDTSYFNFFPTAFIRYTINDNNSLGLSYGRRINRPSYQDLNPFEYIFDNYTRESGNPYLQPEFSNNMELSYAYKQLLNIGIGYSHTDHSLKEISVLKGEITEASTYNIGDELRYYVNLSLSFPVTKWWDSYINLNPFHKEYKGVLPQGRLDNSSWGMGWYGSETFMLPKKWKAQLSSWGSIGTLDGIYKTSWLGSVDAGLSRSFLKGKINTKLSVSDIFNTQRWKQRVDFGNVNFDYLRKWESRAVRLQITYKFGKTTNKARERESGAADENDRIKSK